MLPDQIQARLKEIGTMPDNDVPVIEALLLLAAAGREEIDLAPYQTHFVDMRAALEEEVSQHPPGDEHILAYRLNVLNKIVGEKFGYRGDYDLDDYDDPRNINLLDVIDRKRGIPVAIGVLYFDLAKSQSWPVFGLNFPGHFLLRLDHGSQRMIVDPFHEGKEMDAGKLRQLLKSILGPKAELHHHYYDVVSPRDIVLRFCNNRKTRLISLGRYEDAMQVISHELWVAPNEPRLYFDAGVIASKIGHLSGAIEYLNEFVQMSHDTKTISEARDMIRALQRKLH
ncbi:MAG: hypothetical protein JWM96_412 [Alphaproteobacteria bacterium]|nr:hypothetical protein [Alphaproteobacteria bacterium]